MDGGGMFADAESPEDQVIQVTFGECLQGIFRTADDRLFVIEGRVEHHGNTSETSE